MTARPAAGDTTPAVAPERALPLVMTAPRRGRPPVHWADLTPAERRGSVEAEGQRAYRARQLSSHYFEGLRTDPGTSR